jgi:energy-coupling factor transporter ATP-binding protein EcfA2
LYYVVQARSLSLDGGMRIVIKIKGFSFFYPDSSVPALRDLDLEFHDQEVVLLAGPNGSGKSTLIKSILGIAPRFTGGKATGEILYEGKPVSSFQVIHLAGRIGVVLQDPESQISNSTVWDEVTFGPANLCLPVEEILAQSERSLSAMGIDHLRECSVLALSGGQLQRLSLACLLAMQPKVIILDEPVAHLDPWGVASVVEALKIAQTKVGLIIISSHWLDPFIELASRVVIISEGHIALDFPARDLYQYFARLDNLRVEIPQVCRIYRTLSQQGLRIPASLSLPNLGPSVGIKPIKGLQAQLGKKLLQVSHVAYQYPSGEKPLSDVSMPLHASSNTVLVGHNGVGKSTLARLLAGLTKPTDGVIESVISRPALMLQKPTLGFLGNTVTEEIAFGLRLSQHQVEEWLDRFSLLELREQSPFKISGGEQKRLALAAALVQRPDLLILDEPTVGLDAYQAQVLLKILGDSHSSILCITHDPRVVANVERVVALGGGRVIFDGPAYGLNAGLINYLGFQHVSATARLAMESIDQGIPMIPEQLEVMCENRVL